MYIDEDALQYVREARLIINHQDDWLLDESKPFLGKRIIDIGCGWGNVLNRFVGYELAVGIDNCEPCILELSKRYSSYPNIKVFNIDITDPNIISLVDYKFDTALSVNVFEHIEQDDKAILHAHQILQMNGKFILIVPAHPALYGSMDRSIGHYRRYTKILTKEKLEKAGFNVIHQKYINMVGAVGWLFSGRVLRRRVPPSGQLRIMNRIVPVIRLIESKIETPFGITLLSVAVK